MRSRKKIPTSKVSEAERNALDLYVSEATAASRRFVVLLEKATDLEVALLAHVALAARLGECWEVAVNNCDRI